jgi:hypothetical protein
MFKNITPTSQKTHIIFIAETNLLMLLKEIVDFCFENQTKHMNEECRQNSETADARTTCTNYCV